MAKFTQEKRHIRLTTALGKDVLHVESMTGVEGMSRLFSLELALVSEKQDVAFEQIVGTPVTITVDLLWGGKRFFHGIVNRFVQESGGGTAADDTRVSRYRASVVPWLWLLSRSAESRIYQNMSVPDIIEKVFRDHGFSDYELKLQGSYSPREYCVQYRESHFNFVSRLMEDCGIHYFFEHSNGKHKLILADNPQANAPCKEQKTASYQIEKSGAKDEDVILSLGKSVEIRSGKYALNDYNFEIPNTALKVELPSKYHIGPGSRELYDYPGDYAKKAEGDSIAKVRMEEEEVQIATISGTSNCRAFASGYRFTLANFYRSDLNGKEYVLTAIQHRVRQEVQAGGAFEYLNSFTCIPADVPFRPPRTTSKPFVQGAQTAIVVGPAGDEIYTDKHGRVKVQFHWDREGKKDEKSSCWIRVSQLWAGNGWGAMFIPRIGHEVIVDFLEGDPDNPIITGRVYHGVNTPPYPLPAEMTKSTIKSNSSKGGGGFNELRFEDKKGSEEVFLHGQKDWTITILNDKNQSVGHDETLSVGNDRTKKVAKNQSETVGENKSISVGKDHSETIGDNANISIGKNSTVSVGANSDLSVAKDLTESIGGASSTAVGKEMVVTVGTSSTTQVAETMTVNVGKKLLIEAADEIALQCGSASIILKKNGNILLDGKEISIQGSGAINVKSSSTVKIKGSSILQN